MKETHQHCAKWNIRFFFCRKFKPRDVKLAKNECVCVANKELEVFEVHVFCLALKVFVKRLEPIVETQKEAWERMGRHYKKNGP